MSRRKAGDDGATSMLILLSPAKRLDFSPSPGAPPATSPRFGRETRELATHARTLTAADLKRLMGLSDALAELNVARFAAFGRRGAETSPAALAFAGDVYVGLQARTLDPAALLWAQARLRILSGLYGVLRPLDRIQPYRLEMGVRLENPGGADLYALWRGPVTRSLNRDARGGAVVNLASQEYAGAVDTGALKPPLITCHFKEADADGGVRTVAFYAKRARGRMARFAIDGRIDRAEGLKAFDWDGYRFDARRSDASEWTFTRPAR